MFNRIPKYAASRGRLTPEWANTTQLGEDTAAAMAELRERHEHTHVIGSMDFVQTLFAGQLFDRLTLWVYPILLDSGKKVSADGAVPTNLRLLGPAVSSSKGAIPQHYAREDGVPGVGDMSSGGSDG